MKRVYYIIFSSVILTQSACDFKGISEIDTFRIHPDFQIELVASEPIIFDPVDLKFDEYGRAFVMEMPSYPFPVNSSRVVLLEDENIDGVYDKRTVFAKNLGMGTSILPFQGGLLVTAPPDLLFLKDTDADNVADIREIIMTGFAVENPQHNFNGMMYGVDNWIYAANGGNSGKVHWPDDEKNNVSIKGDDFRFYLYKKIFQRIGKSAGGYGITSDDWGRIFTTHNLEHISNLVFPSRYINDIPVSPDHTLHNISTHDDGESARIYPVGTQETRVNHPEQSGYFSGSCGITYYGGGAFGSELNGNIFVCDVVLNLIHRDVLRPKGTTFAAYRGRQKVEFLASTDRAFRPVHIEIGPDGALYVIDMYRKVIEHPEWIPDEIEVKLDLDAGKGKGRIYRITPQGGLRPATPKFSENNINAVVEKLAHPNKWQRDTAQRLLIEWQDVAAIEHLKELFASSKSPVGRLHSMWTMHGLDQLDDSIILGALQDPHPGVRGNALIIAEELIGGNSDVLETMLNMLYDNNPRVRMQTLLSLSMLQQEYSTNTEEKLYKGLLAIANRDISDPFARMALVSAVRERPLPYIELLLAEKDVAMSTDGRALLFSLARLVGQKFDDNMIVSVVKALYAMDKSDYILIEALLDGLAEGIENRSNTMAEIFGLDQLLEFLEAHQDIAVIRASWRLRKSSGLKPNPRQKALIAESLTYVEDESLTTTKRLEYLAFLEYVDFINRAEVLFRLLSTKTAKEIQLVAIDQLTRSRNVDIAKGLIDKWQTLSPEVRSKASDFLIYFPANHDILLTALENDNLTVGELYLHLERRRAFLFSDDPSIRQRAEALFSDAGVMTRKTAIAAMRPALVMKGNPSSGMVVYNELCAKCHRLGSIGQPVGPDLTEIYRKSPETLLYEIIDPNAAVETQYISYMFEHNNGEIFTGIITHESDTEIGILNADNNYRSVQRSHIKEMSSGGLSLMPEELESGMDLQNMADLIAFLQSRPD